MTGAIKQDHKNKYNLSILDECIHIPSALSFRWADRMGEGPAVRPLAAITPVQQMLASGTGAVLTSFFGEEKNWHNHFSV